ncbi:MAG: hypothetical protein ACO3D0_06280 [Ilumatobacteraceae bacterium]
MRLRQRIEPGDDLGCEPPSTLDGVTHGVPTAPTATDSGRAIDIGDGGSTGVDQAGSRRG